jgi:hypothetical protein
LKSPLLLKNNDTTHSNNLERNVSITKRIPQKLKLIKYSSLLAYIKTDENEENTNIKPVTSRNRTQRKTTKRLNMITDFYNTTYNKPIKQQDHGRQLTPKAKKGQIYFNNYFVKSIASSLKNSNTVVKKDNLPHKINVIDCLAMDNYDRIYHNFYKYSKLLNQSTSKFKSVHISKLTYSKTSLEDLYSKDLIISNKFLKNRQSQVDVLPLIKKKKVADEKNNRSKMHYIFKKINFNRKILGV